MNTKLPITSSASLGARIAACLAASTLIVLAPVAYGQPPAGRAAAPDSNVPPAVAQETAAAEALQLTLDEAVKLALENNRELIVQRIEPNVSAARVAQAASAYLPTFSSSFLQNSQVEPPTSFFVGTSGVDTDTFSSTLALSQRLPWLGGSYAVAWDGARTATASPFTNFNPALNSRLNLAFSQPLLRDRAIDDVRHQLIVSRRNQDSSEARLRETVARTVNGVKRAYWDLVAATASLAVQRQTLALAEELVRQDKARVDAGQMPELDLLAAQADMTQRQEAVTVAEVTLNQAEDHLRTLILDPSKSSFWTTKIVASQPAPVADTLPDIERAVRQALDVRQDLRRARLDLDNARTSTKFFANQRLPDLRLEANYQAVGLAGTRLLRTGAVFPGTVVGRDSTSFADALGQVFTRDFPAWSVGVSFSYPIGRSYEEAGLARARLQETQARTRVESMEMQIVREIRQAGWRLGMNVKRMQTSRAARELAQRRLDAEQKRFEVGMSTSFLVLQAQRDLAQARNAELSALLDYTRSQADFEALQEAPLTGDGGLLLAGEGGSPTTGTGTDGPIVPPATLPGLLQPSAAQTQPGGTNRLGRR
jgi:outer membrane protein TolC